MDTFFWFYRGILVLLIGLGLIIADIWLNWGLAPARREDGMLLFGLLAVVCAVVVLWARYSKFRRAQQPKA